VRVNVRREDIPVVIEDLVQKCYWTVSFLEELDGTEEGGVSRCLLGAGAKYIT